MTYNIRNGRGADGVVDLGRIASVIASYGPDVATLQEVDAGRTRSGTVEQATELAVRLGMSASYAPCVDHGTERYGIATLSRLPFEDTHQIDLPHGGAHRRSEPRCALVTRLAWAGTAVSIVNTHLSVLRAERADQVAALVDAVAETALVIAGDFNCSRWSGAFRALCCGLAPATRGRTWPARLPLFELDHILYRAPLAVVHAGVWEGGGARRASDHLPVVAELEMLADAREDAA